MAVREGGNVGPGMRRGEVEEGRLALADVSRGLNPDLTAGQGSVPGGKEGSCQRRKFWKGRIRG